MQHSDAEEFARARLAYVSAGRRALSAPRRALHDPEPLDEPISSSLSGGATLVEPGTSSLSGGATLVEPGTSSLSGGATLVEPGTSSLSRARPRNEGRVRSKGLEPEPKPHELPDEPDPLPKPTRPPLTYKHLVVVAVLLLCGVGVAVAALGRSAATEVPVAPVTVSQAPPAPTTPPPPVLVRVHVAGAVNRPGVVSLPEGSIVQDALQAAGGLADGADPAHLNLAAAVTDGMQIIVGTVDEPAGDILGAEPPPSRGGGAEASGQVNLNTASQGELESLPGIGPVTARSIIEWREQNGSFSNVEELQEISGIGPKTFQKLQPHVTV